MVVLDAKKNALHVVNPETQTIVHTLPAPPRAAQVGWSVPELECDVADAQGKRLGAVALPRVTP